MAESDDQEEPSASDDDWRLTGQEDVLARAHVSADEPRFCSTYPGPRRRAVALSGNKVWSLYGAPWLQPVAIGGKSRSLRNGRNKRKPLPWVAMVRRGSTVRVRQRASVFSLLIDYLCCQDRRAFAHSTSTQRPIAATRRMRGG